MREDRVRDGQSHKCGGNMLLLNASGEEEVDTSLKTQRLHYKYNTVNGFTKLIPVYFDSHTKQIH
jgi:hypothetical protein